MPDGAIGLVGRNGAGKSTLLRAIIGEIALDGGEIRLAARARLAAVRQEAPDGPASLLDTVLAADPERLSLLAESGTAPPERLADMHERLRAIDADSAPARAAAILAGLGFDEAAQAPAGGLVLRRLADAGRAGRRRCSPRPTCCCWTSRPTTSTSKRPCGWKAGWRAFPARR